MKKKGKISTLLEPRMQSCFVFLAVFSLATLWLHRYLGMAELVIVLLLYINYLHRRKFRNKEIERYIQSASFSMDTASKDTMLNTPIPMVIFRPESDEIVWNNEPFNQITGQSDRAFDVQLESIVPNFHYQWLLDGKKENPEETELNGRRYQVLGHIVRMDDGGSSSVLLATTYWIDITAHTALKDDFAASRPVAAIIALDNYEELMKGVGNTVQASLLASIDDKITAWAKISQGPLSQYSRERYFFLFEARYLDGFLKSKFAVLNEVRSVISPNNISATLSIGIGRDAATYEELFQFASLALEMALSRGGDQTVVKNRINFEFYGGRKQETERRTKVKSRVMANAFHELISGASHVFVMGHKNADLDALGAAVGVCAIARNRKVPAFIIREPQENPSQPLLERLLAHEEYRHMLISPQDAIVKADTNSVLVVVDTNRPEQVQAPQLLEACTKVAVIDHHRRASTYITNAALSFQDTYASSACELVTELMGYLLEPRDVLTIEAEALLSGIVLDTKGFNMRTGTGTFEAAAYLRRIGADTNTVKKLLQSDLSSTIARYAIIQSAQMHRQNIAIAAVSSEVHRVIAAQAADELLNVAGVEASFVVFPDGARTMISGRSSGVVNVQMILEALGGGGNATIAGAQLEDTTPEQALPQLHQAIGKFLEG